MGQEPQRDASNGSAAPIRDRNLVQRLGSVALLLPVVLWAVRHGGTPLVIVVTVAVAVGAFEMATMSLQGQRLLSLSGLAAVSSRPSRVSDVASSYIPRPAPLPSPPGAPG